MLALLSLFATAVSTRLPLPACELQAWAEIRELRSQAYVAGDYDRALELAECEIRALQHAPDWLRDGGFPVHACDPLEVIFKICNERSTGPDCAGATLDRYKLAGCDALPSFAGEYHRQRAQYHQRRMEYGEALAALAAAEELDAVCWYVDPGPVCAADLHTNDDSILELAIVASQRVQIAAELRGWSAARAGVADAMDLLARAVSSRTGAIADVQNLLAWSMLLAREVGVDAGDPTPLLTAALEVFDKVGSASASNVSINLGLAALQHDAPGDVEPALARVVLADLSPEEKLWLRVVQIRAALATGDTTGVDRWLRDIAEIADAGHAPMGRWFAAWIHGLVHEAASRTEPAIAAYAAAEAELERLAHGPLALEDSRASDRAYINFADATRRLVLVQLGDPAAAARTARTARTRAFRVAARTSCPAAEHVREDPPALGELRLLYFPASPQAPTGRPMSPLWAGFAITTGSVRAELLKLPLPADWQTATDEQLSAYAAVLLEPFRTELEQATELVVLPTGELNTVPFHALPWGSDILLGALPVRYGFDIATCGGALTDHPDAVQVLRDPAIDFTRESRGVEAAWTERGYTATTTEPQTSADLAALLAEPAAVVHIAAHGQQFIQDGLFAADDRLVFANGLTLTRPQILAARATPAVVFMSSCRSSFVDAEALGGGLSLAQAFMIRGSQFVVGADGDLDGELATAFATHFHAELAARPLHDTPIAWQRAYLKTRAEVDPRERPGMRMLRLFGQ